MSERRDVYPIYLFHPFLIRQASNESEDWENIVFHLLRLDGFQQIERRSPPDGGIDITGLSSDGDACLFQCKWSKHNKGQLHLSKVKAQLHGVLSNINRFPNPTSRPPVWVLCTNVTTSGDFKSSLRESVASSSIRLRFLEREHWTHLLLQPEADRLRLQYIREAPQFMGARVLTFIYGPPSDSGLLRIQIEEDEPVSVAIDRILSRLPIDDDIHNVRLVHKGRIMDENELFGNINLDPARGWRLELIGKRGTPRFLFGKKSEDWRRLASLETVTSNASIIPHDEDDYTTKIDALINGIEAGTDPEGIYFKMGNRVVGEPQLDLPQLYVEAHESIHYRILCSHAYGCLQVLCHAVVKYSKPSRERRTAIRLRDILIQGSINAHESLATYLGFETLTLDMKKEVYPFVHLHKVYASWYDNMSRRIDPIAKSSYVRYAIGIGLMRTLFNPNWAHNWLVDFDLEKLTDIKQISPKETPDHLMAVLFEQWDVNIAQSIRNHLSDVLKVKISQLPIALKEDKLLDSEKEWENLESNLASALEQTIALETETWIKFSLLSDLAPMLIPPSGRTIPDKIHIKNLPEDMKSDRIFKLLGKIEVNQLRWGEQTDVQLRATRAVYHKYRNPVAWSLDCGIPLLKSTDGSNEMILANSAIVVTRDHPAARGGILICAAQVSPGQGGYLVEVDFSTVSHFAESIGNPFPVLVRATEYALISEISDFIQSSACAGVFVYADDSVNFHRQLWSMSRDSTAENGIVPLHGSRLRFQAVLIATGPKEVTFKLAQAPSEGFMRLDMWTRERFKGNPHDHAMLSQSRLLFRAVHSAVAFIEVL